MLFKKTTKAVHEQVANMGKVNHEAITTFFQEYYKLLKYFYDYLFRKKK